MNIQILYGIEGAKNARGIAVIIDIYRAASTASYALHHGVKHIIPVSTVKEAFILKSKHPRVLLAGETNGQFIEGFDFGNSPFAMTQHDIKDKIMVQRTSMGVQGLVNATEADEIIFGSFPTLSAIKRYINKQTPHTVSIVAMDGPDTEDEIFAFVLQDHLQDKPIDHEKIRKNVFNHPRSERFFDPANTHSPEEDAHLCLTIDCFDFCCYLERKKFGNRLIKKRA